MLWEFFAVAADTNDYRELEKGNLCGSSERERERESKRVCFWERESEKVRKREAEREENLNTENICVYEKSLIGFPWKQVGGKLKKNSRKEKF